MLGVWRSGLLHQGENTPTTPTSPCMSPTPPTPTSPHFRAPKSNYLSSPPPTFSRISPSSPRTVLPPLSPSPRLLVSSKQPQTQPPSQPPSQSQTQSQLQLQPQPQSHFRAQSPQIDQSLSLPSFTFFSQRNQPQSQTQLISTDNSTDVPHIKFNTSPRSSSPRQSRFVSPTHRLSSTSTSNFLTHKSSQDKSSYHPRFVSPLSNSANTREPIENGPKQTHSQTHLSVKRPHFQKGAEKGKEKDRNHDDTFDSKTKPSFQKVGPMSILSRMTMVEVGSNGNVVVSSKSDSKFFEKNLAPNTQEYKFSKKLTITPPSSLRRASLPSLDRERTGSPIAQETQTHPRSPKSIKSMPPMASDISLTQKGVIVVNDKEDKDAPGKLNSGSPESHRLSRRLNPQSRVHSAMHMGSEEKSRLAVPVTESQNSIYIYSKLDQDRELMSHRSSIIRELGHGSMLRKVGKQACQNVNSATQVVEAKEKVKKKRNRMKEIRHTVSATRAQDWNEKFQSIVQSIHEMDEGESLREQKVLNDDLVQLIQVCEFCVLFFKKHKI
jgi:hypothetical protein